MAVGNLRSRGSAGPFKENRDAFDGGVTALYPRAQSNGPLLPGQDSRNIIRQLQQRRGHWLCWYGNVSGHYWAMTRSGSAILVEGKSPEELLDEMNRVDKARGGNILARV